LTGNGGPPPLDLGRLGDWMATTLGASMRPGSAEQFGVGQSNPTYRLRAGGGELVLRRKTAGALLPSAHAVDREFRVMRALRGSGVPVPECFALCTDDTVIGSAFYVMEYVRGRAFADPGLPDLAPTERAALWDSMNAVMARLHGVDHAAIGLQDFGRPGNFFARQIGRMGRQYRASETTRIEAMERLLEALPACIPSDEETAIAHGDFRIDNMIFDPVAPRVIAVLDWELATIGDPRSDFAYHMMLWRLPRASYRFGIGDCEFGACGIPPEAAYRAAYCRRSGRAGIAHWEFFIAFNLFRLAAILQGIAARAASGTAASSEAAATGARAAAIAEIGWNHLKAVV
jgi:aminoglycoside phosphotransferase (APT) family kinase protein